MGASAMTAARPRPWQLLLAALAIWLVLIFPDRPGTPARGLLRLPPELPLLLLIAALPGPGTGGRIIRLALTLLLLALALLKLLDLAMFEILGRPFNPVADLALIDAAIRVVAGSVGGLAAAFALLVSGSLLAGLGLVIWRALGVWSRLDWPRVPVAVALFVTLVVTVMLPVAGPSRFLADRAVLARQSLSDLRLFRQMARTDPFAHRTDLLDAIDRGLLVIFIESYGRTSFDTAFYADAHLPILREAEADLARAGLAMRSGFLISPTQGGQSWLAHASFANGLPASDQSRYLAALASGRLSLFHHARRAGFRTAAVMPAITRPWPEAQRMGFDLVLAAGDLGYRGKPFNWVTMPDQFTLSAADRLLRRGSDDPRRLFAQIALISSHAPWVPVPELIGWDQIGEGQVFNAMAEAGDPPRVVWRDRDRVKQQYRLAIAYSLQTVMSYALSHADDPPLLIVLGDHQAAASIAQDSRRDVPIHIIGPRALVERSAAWGFAPGLIPPPGTAPIPMEAMRDLILRDFTDAPAQHPPS